MKKFLTKETIFVWLLHGLFILTAIFVFQARLLETPSVQVDHFIAGAGGLGLCVLYPLAFVIGVYYLHKYSLLDRDQRWKGRVYLALVILPLIMAASIHASLERKAPDYTQKAYDRIVTAFEERVSITKDDVLEQLGLPLSQEKFGGREVWSYTYMTSTGFGWHKRILIFGSTGEMIDFNNTDEP